MTSAGDLTLSSTVDKATQAPPATQQDPQQASVDLESRGDDGGGGVANVVRRWKREDLVKKGTLASRGLAFVFSLLSFIIMAANKHGDWRNFEHYEEYRYLVAITILSTLYTGLQVLRLYKELSAGRPLFSWQHMSKAEYIADQITAYLLLSAASSAVPLTNRMREGADNIFTDQSSAAISMAFFAFFAMALLALISGYKLTQQSF